MHSLWNTWQQFLSSRTRSSSSMWFKHTAHVSGTHGILTLMSPKEAKTSLSLIICEEIEHVDEEGGCCCCCCCCCDDEDDDGEEELRFRNLMMQNRTHLRRAITTAALYKNWLVIKVGSSSKKPIWAFEGRNKRGATVERKYRENKKERKGGRSEEHLVCI